MCGITGIITKDKNIKSIIEGMSKRIEHRGPDGEGYFFDGDVALAHRRLAIIDVGGGNQPMYNEDKNVVTVYNGEIYNYIELKDELKKLGHTFSTKSDTEVLVHGYEEWGEELPKHLRGMFAFAIYDLKKKTLFLARDPFGIKPLYYAHMNSSFMFASEPKAFLDVPSFKKEFNEDILETFLEFSFVPTTETFFKGVYRLDAGTTLMYHDNKFEIKSYYKLDFKEKDLGYEKSVSQIADVMKDSVERHLLSDVEVGSFLSSGVDSSYLVSLAKPDKTYTVGYDIPKYNEIDYAKDLTDKLRISNTSKKINWEESRAKR